MCGFSVRQEICKCLYLLGAEEGKYYPTSDRRLNKEMRFSQKKHKFIIKYL